MVKKEHFSEPEIDILTFFFCPQVMFVYFCRLPMKSLSKFAICLSDQHLQHSPLMGHITSILSQKLSSIDDARSVLTQMSSDLWDFL